MADEDKSYATIQDVEIRLMHAIPDDMITYVSNMIQDASEFISEFVDEFDLNPSDTTLKRVCVDEIVSWYSTASIPTGAESISQSADNVSQTVSFGTSGTSSMRSPWWLSREQKRQLGLREIWGSITMTNGGKYYE